MLFTANAVDQLQVVQDQPVAQETETKKLSEQIAMLTEKARRLRLRRVRRWRSTEPSKVIPSRRMGYL
jgi:hypothetical protein